MQQTVIEWESKIANADHSDEDVILPLVLYLSSARLWKDGNKRTVKTGVLSRTDAYSHCLDAQHGLDIAFRYIDTLKAVTSWKMMEKFSRLMRSFCGRLMRRLEMS